MRDHYDFRKGVRGKYAKPVAKGGAIVVLDADVASQFPDDAAVNAALRKLLKQRKKSSRPVT